MAQILDFRRKPNPPLGRGWTVGRIVALAICALVIFGFIGALKKAGVLDLFGYGNFLLVASVAIAAIIIGRFERKG